MDIRPGDVIVVPAPEDRSRVRAELVAEMGDAGMGVAIVTHAELWPGGLRPAVQRDRVFVMDCHALAAHVLALAGFGENTQIKTLNREV